MEVYGIEGLTRRSQAYDLLAAAAAECWGLFPLPPLERLPEGKPWFPGRPDLQFNLSHSGTLALCALDSAPVGADIQAAARRRPGLPARVCSQAELAWLEGQGDQELGFAILWALKESRVKQSGEGLRQRLPSIPIPIPEEGAGLYVLDSLWFRVYTGPGWAGAVCGLHPPPEEIRWRRAEAGP